MFVSFRIGNSPHFRFVPVSLLERQFGFQYLELIGHFLAGFVGHIIKDLFKLSAPDPVFLVIELFDFRDTAEFMIRIFSDCVFGEDVVYSPIDSLRTPIG